MILGEQPGSALDNSVRAIGVGGESRAVQLPDVPTIDEAGLKGFRSTGWNGLFAPKGTPNSISVQLVAAIRNVLSSATVRESVLRSGVEPALLTGTDYTKFMHDELKRFEAAVKAARLKPN